MDKNNQLRAYALDGVRVFTTPFRSIQDNAWDLGDGSFLCYVEEGGALSIPGGATVVEYPKVLMPVYKALLSNTYMGDRAEPFLTFKIARGNVINYIPSFIKSDAKFLDDRVVYTPRDYRKALGPSLGLLRRPAGLRWYTNNAPFGIGYGSVAARRRREKSRFKTHEVEHKTKANFVIGLDRLGLYDFAPIANFSRADFDKGLLPYPRPYHGNTNHDHFWPGLWNVEDSLVNFEIPGKMIEIEEIRAFGFSHRDFVMLSGNFIEVRNVYIQEVYERVIAI